MYSDISKIKFVFENLESFALCGSFVDYMNLWNIWQGATYDGESYQEWERCEFFTIRLKKEANQLATLESGHKWKLFDRLQCGDLVSVVIQYATPTGTREREIYMPWDERWEEHNPWQKDGVGENGMLYLVCSGTDCLQDVYPDTIFEEQSEDEYGGM